MSSPFGNHRNIVFSLVELEKEMNQLRSGLKAVEKELEYHRTQSHATTAGDRFVPAVKEFMASATCRFSDLEDKFQDMKNRVRYFKLLSLNVLLIIMSYFLLLMT